MKNLVVYSDDGIIILKTEVTEVKNYKCLVTDVEQNQEIVSVNVETNTVMTKEKELSLEEQNEKLVDKVIDLTAENLSLKGDA